MIENNEDVAAAHLIYGMFHVHMIEHVFFSELVLCQGILSIVVVS